VSIRIGISGWRYKGWRGNFYPDELTQKRELAYASRQFSTIELNGSFYSLQRAASYRRWHDATPDNFVFAVKGSRFITHSKRLRDVEVPLANFLASGVLALGDKLGPLLWQFPASFRWDAEAFGDFLELLPRTTGEAAKLARRHDDRVAQPQLKVERDRPLRHAFEVRHDSFRNEDFIALLRRHDAALVVADSAGKYPRLEDVTAGFLYLRLHGDTQLYTSGYGDKALRRWAERIARWSRGRQPDDAERSSGKAPPRRKHRDVYVYFDNDAKTCAPFDARKLYRLLRGDRAA
jgi:uncharacterized protein YecE (DUF72 family)